MKENKELTSLNIDITQVLKDTENALRDFISQMLHAKYKEDWIDKCGVSNERIEKWKMRQHEEEKRHVTVERLIYYADFYDLKTILQKNWDDFSQIFGSWRTIEVWLDELEKLRNPEAHRRELLPHQKHLAIGIAGEIRTMIVRYRSKQETSEDYFPRIECIRDNFGNIWTPTLSENKKTILRPGDLMEFVVTASDPLDAALEYRMDFEIEKGRWQKENTFSMRISQRHIGRNVLITFDIRSPRDYHAIGPDYDDTVRLYYEILPAKQDIK